MTAADGAPVPDTAARFDALTQLSPHPDAVELALLPTRLCQAAVRVLAIDGAAISVCLGIDVSVSIGANDPDATAAEELQFTLGQGPCLESARGGKSVFVPDLEQSGPSKAWPVYVSEVTRRTPYRAVFCFPLTLVGFTVGTLNLYRRSAGQTLSEDEVAAVHHITSRIATDLRAATMFDIAVRENNYEWMNASSARRRHQVWVAQGMTMQASNVTARVALALLRAHAYASDRLLDDLAEDVIHHRVPPPDLRV
jgi:GAF domain-containing protein